MYTLFGGMWTTYEQNLIFILAAQFVLIYGSVLSISFKLKLLQFVFQYYLQADCIEFNLKHCRIVIS